MSEVKKPKAMDETAGTGNTPPLAAVVRPDSATARYRPVVEVLAAIRLDRYIIQRCGKRAEITEADIKRARRVLDGAGTGDDARKATAAMAGLPDDYMQADAQAPLYAFPSERGGGDVNVSNDLIRQAQRLVQE